jgi:predicted dehydrogenase
VHGCTGCIRVRTVGFLNFAVEVESTVLPEYTQSTRLHTPYEDDVRMVMHVPQVEAFAQSIRAGTSPAVTLAEARAALSVIDAAFKSGKAGVPVCPAGTLAERHAC